MSNENTTTYIVKDMSCGHCEAAVRGEIAKVSGVEAVQVDLASKRVVVHGAFQDTDVRAAIDEAGYEAA